MFLRVACFRSQAGVGLACSRLCQQDTQAAVTACEGKSPMQCSSFVCCSDWLRCHGQRLHQHAPWQQQAAPSCTQTQLPADAGCCLQNCACTAPSQHLPCPGEHPSPSLPLAAGWPPSLIRILHLSALGYHNSPRHSSRSLIRLSCPLPALGQRQPTAHAGAAGGVCRSAHASGGCAGTLPLCGPPWLIQCVYDTSALPAQPP